MKKRNRMIALAMSAAMASGLVIASAGAASANDATNPPTENQRLVNAWYVDFLDRAEGAAVSDQGSRYWIDKLDRGESRTSVLNELTHTREFANNEVKDTYELYLGRDSDYDPGSQYWVNGIQNDMAPEWVVQNVLASKELARTGYYDNQNIDNFLRLLYRDVVGREELPSQGELDYWKERLNQLGGDRLRLVREMWYTDEAVKHRIELHYFTLLQRTNTKPSASEVNYWRNPEITSDIRTKIAFASTPEYLAQATTFAY